MIRGLLRQAKYMAVGRYVKKRFNGWVVSYVLSKSIFEIPKSRRMALNVPGVKSRLPQFGIVVLERVAGLYQIS